MESPIQRRAGHQRGALGCLLGVLDAQRTPVSLASFARQAFHRCLPLTLAPVVATMVRVKQEQMYSLLGDVPLGGMEGRSEERMDQFDQRRSGDKSIQWLTYPRLTRGTLQSKAACGTIQPLVALVLRRGLVCGRRLGGERGVVPSPPPGLSASLRSQSKQGGMQGCGVGTRGDALVKRGAKRWQKWRQSGLRDRFDQAKQARPRCADAGNGPEPPAGGTQREGVAEQRAQEIARIVACARVLTRVGGLGIALETLGQRGRACGGMAGVRGLGLLGQGRRGLALQWAAPGQEGAQRRTPITPPARVVARRVRARHEAPSTGGGHADAGAVVRASVVNMGVPGLG